MISCVISSGWGVIISTRMASLPPWMILSVMEEVGLDTDLAGRRPAELSGGQRQRAAIARALISDPAVIIADEPLTGLDVTAQAKIVHLLRDLTDRRGLAVLLIAHDRPMVEHVSTRVMEMETLG